MELSSLTAILYFPKESFSFIFWEMELYNPKPSGGNFPSSKNLKDPL